jgi:hypothetical protein
MTDVEHASPMIAEIIRILVIGIGFDFADFTNVDDVAVTKSLSELPN